MLDLDDKLFISSFLYILMVITGCEPSQSTSFQVDCWFIQDLFPPSAVMLGAVWGQRSWKIVTFCFCKWCITSGKELAAQRRLQERGYRQSSLNVGRTLERCVGEILRLWLIQYSLNKRRSSLRFDGFLEIALISGKVKRWQRHVFEESSLEQLFHEISHSKSVIFFSWDKEIKQQSGGRDGILFISLCWFDNFLRNYILIFFNWFCILLR